MTSASEALRIEVREEADVFVARRRAHDLAVRQGFTPAAAAAVATAVSEVARNIVVHARAGEITLSPAEAERPRRRGVTVVARDPHPGIPDVAKAMQDGYSTGTGLGLGLPSARRLMDEFAIESAPGAGTTVTMAKWVHAGRK